MIATALAYSQNNSNPDDAFVTDSALRHYLDEYPFQHGSLHGYEDGYQAGDIDFHLQRPQPEFVKVKEYRSATRGYVDGDKQEYRAGYQAGYRFGYQDAQSGRQFAAMERLRAAAEHKPVVMTPPDPDPMEEVVSQGGPAPSAAAMPINVPISALFPAQPTVLPPSPSAKESALARIMNNLRRTFMPAVVTPQAVVSGSHQ